jgi:cobalt-zinc-cadmium efflux system membrane fusion protein
MNIQTVIVLSCVLLASCVPKAASAPEAKGASAPARDLVVDVKTQQQLGVEVQPAVAQAVAAPITAAGQLQMNEDRTWQVGAVIEGRIVAFPVHLGDSVQAGEVIAQMHSHEVHDSRASRRQAVAEKEKLKVVAEQALRVRDRTRRLFELKAASREQVEAADTQYRSAQLNVSNAQAEVDKTEAHLTEFLDVPLEDSARAEVRADEADRVPIKAPASGTVMERRVNVGSVVSTGDPVITISDLSSLWLIAAVNEADLSRIRPGQDVRVSVRAYSDKTFPGKVFQLGERLDPHTRTLQVRVLVSNIQGMLKPDMFTTAEFSGRPEGSAVHVPETAIQEINGTSVVFVRTSAQTFGIKKVKVGRRLNRQVEILSGIDAQTPVVVSGAFLLKSQLLKDQAN